MEALIGAGMLALPGCFQRRDWHNIFPHAGTTEPQLRCAGEDVAAAALHIQAQARIRRIEERNAQ
jgi:hypothetical protein